MDVMQELIGKVITKIKLDGVDLDECGEITENEEVLFYCSDSTIYKMYHEQDCCEYVRLYDVSGDMGLLIDSAITMAEKATSEGMFDSTWTFYKFATVKGYVTLRWLGESSGYYSEEVDFIKLESEE